MQPGRDSEEQRGRHRSGRVRGRHPAPPPSVAAHETDSGGSPLPAYAPATSRPPEISSDLNSPALPTSQLAAVSATEQDSLQPPALPPQQASLAAPVDVEALPQQGASRGSGAEESPTAAAAPSSSGGWGRHPATHGHPLPPPTAPPPATPAPTGLQGEPPPPQSRWSRVGFLARGAPAFRSISWV